MRKMYGVAVWHGLKEQWYGFVFESRLWSCCGQDVHTNVPIPDKPPNLAQKVGTKENTNVMLYFSLTKENIFVKNRWQLIISICTMIKWNPGREISASLLTWMPFINAVAHREGNKFWEGDGVMNVPFFHPPLPASLIFRQHKLWRVTHGN